MSLPSIKRIEQYFPGNGKQIRSVLESVTVAESMPETKDWIRACFNRPKDWEIKLSAINEIIGGYGVEYEKGIGSFVNMGDTYATTIIRRAPNHYIVSDWGSIAERL